LAALVGGALVGWVYRTLIVGISGGPGSTADFWALNDSTFHVGLFFGAPLGAFLFHRLAGRGGSRPARAGVTNPSVRRTPLGWVHLALYYAGVGFLLPLAFTNMPSGPPSMETAAIATLRNLAACQVQMQMSGRIDCDGDKVGEYGTFLELTGSTPVRAGYFPGDPAGSDFSKAGEKVNPPILSPALAGVDARGIATKSGYCFVIYLPGDSKVAGFVHETGPAATPGLSGRVGVDVSEQYWCAYAWPAARGKSGNRSFFVNQAGDVLQSDNEVAKWDGPAKPPPGNSAFRAGGITGQVAVGTAGQDGDVWKVVN
jgi:hypothetical protein